MAADFELTDEMRSVIGVESEPWPVEVTTTSIRAFARGVGYTDLRYYDEALSDGSLPAPPCYLGTPVWIPGRSDVTFSGPKNAGPSVRHGLSGLLDGGTEVVYERPLVAGDRLLMTTKVADLQVKESKGLGKMLVVTSEQEFRDESTGEVVMRTYGQGIYY
jgi:N-terminal half of MaoC dehydratase